MSLGYPCYPRSFPNRTNTSLRHNTPSILFPDYSIFTPKQANHLLCAYVALSRLLCFFHAIVPSSFGFAALFGVQTRTQVCPLLKSLLPHSTELIRSRFRSYISAQTTQILRNRLSPDSTAALPWFKRDQLSHLIRKFTAAIAGCSLLIPFNDSLAKRLKLAVKSACREYTLGSGSLPHRSCVPGV